MTVFNVSASVQLRGYLDTYSVGDIEIDMPNTEGVDVHDQSVESGELEARLDVRFTVEADSQDEAEEAADAAFESFNIGGSGDNIEWEYESHDVESVEGPPMDKERAKEIVLAFLSDGDLPEDVQDALRFLVAGL